MWPLLKTSRLSEVGEELLYSPDDVAGPCKQKPRLLMDHGFKFLGKSMEDTPARVVRWLGHGLEGVLLEAVRKWRRPTELELLFRLCDLHRPVAN